MKEGEKRNKKKKLCAFRRILSFCPFIFERFDDTDPSKARFAPQIDEHALIRILVRFEFVENVSLYPLSP